MPVPTIFVSMVIASLAEIFPELSSPFFSSLSPVPSGSFSSVQSWSKNSLSSFSSLLFFLSSTHLVRQQSYPNENDRLLLVYFFRSMCTDPGIILRPTSLERLMFHQHYHVNEMTSTHLNQLIFDISINHLLVQCKYCITCQMIRPPRSSHCAICSNCISILDHHCPFLSTCIGMRNYRFFIFFLFFLLQTELVFFATTLTKVMIVRLPCQIHRSLFSRFSSLQRIESRFSHRFPPISS